MHVYSLSNCLSFLSWASSVVCSFIRSGIVDAIAYWGAFSTPFTPIIRVRGVQVASDMLAWHLHTVRLGSAFLVCGPVCVRTSLVWDWIADWKPRLFAAAAADAIDSTINSARCRLTKVYSALWLEGSVVLRTTIQGVRWLESNTYCHQRVHANNKDVFPRTPRHTLISVFGGCWLACSKSVRLFARERALQVLGIRTALPRSLCACRRLYFVFIFFRFFFMSLNLVLNGTW